MKACDEKLSTGKIENGRRWYLAHEGNTMAIINGPGRILDGETTELSMGTERRGPTPCHDQALVRDRHDGDYDAGSTTNRTRCITSSTTTTQPHQLYGVVPCG